MPNKFIEKLAIDLAISCEGNTTRTQRIENTLKALTSYRDEILKEIDDRILSMGARNLAMSPSQEDIAKTERIAELERLKSTIKQL